MRSDGQLGPRGSFQVARAGLPSGKSPWEAKTLAVIGATVCDGRTGFYLFGQTSPVRRREKS